jgi:hypothetical protein
MSHRGPAVSSLVLLGAAFGAACGARVIVDTGGTGERPSCSTGSPTPAGDCQADADCDGGTCAPVTPGGYKVCLATVPEATQCTPHPVGPDECCSSADCKHGGCYSSANVPSCDTPLHNECVVDACTNDAECHGETPEICVPAGAWGYARRACIQAYCHTDADCTAAPCGRCAVIYGLCCPEPQGIGCVYPGGCHDDDDCWTATDGGEPYCALQDGTGQCFGGPMLCPD